MTKIVLEKTELINTETEQEFFIVRWLFSIVRWLRMAISWKNCSLAADNGGVITLER